MKRTPLYDFHLENNAKIVEFAGWLMPVRYSELITEHNATRKAAGLFDVSHMGEILVSGSTAEKTINYLCSNDLEKIIDGQAQYSAFLNNDGGVVDDLIIYKFNKNQFLLCVNASNLDKDYKWMLDNNLYKAEIKNVSNHYGQIAIQGPKAESILALLIPEVSELKYFYFTQSYYKDIPLIVARTGYTGEDGFEIFIPTDKTLVFTKELYNIGSKHGLVLCGLGARDTLRLEAGYPLHGHEIRDDLPAIYSGLSWIIKFQKEEFIGKEKLLEIRNSKNKQVLVGFECLDAGIVREKTLLFDNNKTKIGEVTSGTKTPTINKSIGMAIIDEEYSKIDTEIFADVRGRELKLKVVKLPFYKRGSKY